MNLLTKFSPEHLLGLVALLVPVLGAVLCGLIAICADHAVRLRQLALKQDMLNRGMSAEEIRIVLDAGTTLRQRQSAGEVYLD